MARAALFEGENGGNSGAWNNAANWSNGLPTASTVTTFSTLPGDAPVSITVNPGDTAYHLNFANTGSRSYTFSGSALTFTANTGGITPRILTPNASGAAAITFNNDIFLTHATPTTSGTLAIGGSLASTSQFSTLTFNGNTLTDAAVEGNGGRSVSINSHANSTIIFNGRSEATHTTFAGAGEVIANNISAFGNEAVQKTTSSTLSLRNDLTITGATNSYSWMAGNSVTSIRISETAPNSDDRVLTMEKRIAGRLSISRALVP